MHAKLVAKHARNGGSPFQTLGIEEVYDSLKKLLYKGNDPLSEFVTSWDATILPSSFDRSRFEDILDRAFNALRHGIGSAAGGAPRELAKTIDRGFQGAEARDPESHLRPYFRALVDCLQSADGDLDYIKPLLEYARTSCDLLGSLNYDLIVENACSELNLSYDYGLSEWPESKIVKFHGKSLKLAKLHGSINWRKDGDEIQFDDGQGGWDRALIFGGQSEKLTPDGPFLQLRYQFEQALRGTNKLGIIGYSFQDAHLNALIRVWLATRTRSKLVVLSPQRAILQNRKIGELQNIRLSQGLKNFTVEAVHIEKRAVAGIDDLIRELEAEPVLPSAENPSQNIRVVN